MSRRNSRITRTWFLHLPRWTTTDAPAPTNWKAINYYQLLPLFVATCMTMAWHWSSPWPIGLTFFYFLGACAVRGWRRGSWCEAHWHSPREVAPGDYDCEYCGASLNTDEVAVAVRACAAAQDEAIRTADAPQARWSNRR